MDTLLLPTTTTNAFETSKPTATVSFDYLPTSLPNERGSAFAFGRKKENTKIIKCVVEKVNCLSGVFNEGVGTNNETITNNQTCSNDVILNKILGNLYPKSYVYNDNGTVRHDIDPEFVKTIWKFLMTLDKESYASSTEKANSTICSPTPASCASIRDHTKRSECYTTKYGCIVGMARVMSNVKETVWKSGNSCLGECVRSYKGECDDNVLDTLNASVSQQIGRMVSAPNATMPLLSNAWSGYVMMMALSV